MFNRKFKGIPQVSKEYLEEVARGIRTTIEDLRSSTESKHRLLELEWIKVSALLKSQMGRMNKLARIDADEPPEVLPQPQQTSSNDDKTLTHEQINDIARQQGLIR